MRYLLLFLMLCASVFGAAFLSDASGDWNSNVTWGKGAGAVEGVNYPGAGDTVTIAAGHTVVLNIASVNATSITNATSGTMTLNSAVVTCVITANLISAGTDDLITVAGTGTVTVTGNLTNTEVGGASDWCLELTNAATVIINGNITGGTGGGGASGTGGIYALDASTITVNGTMNGGTGNYLNPAIWFAVTGGTLNCTTLAYDAGSAAPLIGILPTMNIATITIDGVAIGGGGGYRGRYNFN